MEYSSLKRWHLLPRIEAIIGTQHEDDYDDAEWDDEGGEEADNDKFLVVDEFYVLTNESTWSMVQISKWPTKCLST